MHVITIGYYTHKGRKHDVKAVRKLPDISSSSIQESSGRGEEIHILVRGGGQGMVRIKWDAGWRWEGIAQHVLTEAVRVGPRSSFRFVRRLRTSTEVRSMTIAILSCLKRSWSLFCGSRKKQSVKELRCAGGVCLYGVVI